MFCCMLLYVHSSFAIIVVGKRELVALLSLSSWCLVTVVWLFLAVSWVYLRFVIVIFPDHNRLLFLFVYIYTYLLYGSSSLKLDSILVVLMDGNPKPVTLSTKRLSITQFILVKLP